MEEKMMILKMLQEGKITVEEAHKLLEALDKGSGSAPGSNTGASTAGSKIDDLREEITAKINDMKLDEKLSKLGEKATKIAETLGEKAGRLAGQIGENLNSNSERISGNTKEFTEDLAKRMEALGNDIAESASKFAEQFANQFGSLFDFGFEKYKYTSTYSYPAAETCDIVMKSSNFSIRVLPSETPNVVLNIHVNSNIPQLNLDEHFKAVIDGSSFDFSTQFPGRTWGRIEMLVPKNLGSLALQTDNGKCEVGGIQANAFKCHTSNGKIIVTECACDDINALTDNGRITLDKTDARLAYLRTSNAKIELDACRIDNIDAKTSNSSIQLGSMQKKDAVEAKYNLSTSNSKIAVGLAKCPDCGYMIDAYTSLGNISVVLPELVYNIDRKSAGMQNSAQIKSANYDVLENKIYIKATTSNASISVEE